MTSVVHDPPLAPERTEGPAPAAPGGGRWRQVWALVGICVLAGLFYVWAIGSSDYGNAYYSATARSMTENFSNFLFGAFDPYGLVSVDKPPMSLWPQAISASIFGFHSWSVLLPQVIEGMLAVFLLHRTVRLWAGENIALLAALIFALTPVTVAINRGNNPDVLLVLLLVASAYALTRSIHTDDGRSRTTWLLLCAFLVGCGFTTKWMQAWIIVPGLAVAFLVCSPSPVKRRIADLLGAGAVLAVSSFWWPVLHDLRLGDAPYMGASMDGSAMGVIFGYNGFGKIFGYGQEYNGSGLNVSLGSVGMGGGIPDINRMFIPEVGDQIAWLLPLSLLVLGVVAAAGYRRLWFDTPGDSRQRAGWLLWGTWLVVTGLVFSFVQGIWHPYYTTVLAPAIAAISAAGIALLWRTYRDARGYEWTLLPVAIALTATWVFALISRDTPWNGWSRWAVLGTAVVAVAGLVLGRLSPGQRRALGNPALVVGVVSMLLAPAAWSVGTAFGPRTNGGFPSAGPQEDAFSALMRGELPEGAQIPGMEGVEPSPPRGGGLGGAELSDENRRILDYAVRNSGGAEITLAVEGGGLAAGSFIIQSDETVIGMGGYLGADHAPSIGQLQQWVEQGELRYVLSAREGEGDPRLGGIAGIGGELQQERLTWTRANCEAVDPTAYGSAPFEPLDELLPLPGFSDSALYDCRQALS